MFPGKIIWDISIKSIQVFQFENCSLDINLVTKWLFLLHTWNQCNYVYNWLPRCFFMLFICKCIFLLLLHNPYLLHGNYCVKGLNEVRSKFSITHVHQSEDMKSSCDVQGQEEEKIEELYWWCLNFELKCERYGMLAAQAVYQCPLGGPKWPVQAGLSQNM